MAAKPTVFIDGESGTTGLQIYTRLNQREDIELVRIDAAKRKDVTERAPPDQYSGRGHSLFAGCSRL